MSRAPSSSEERTDPHASTVVGPASEPAAVAHASTMESRPVDLGATPITDELGSMASMLGALARPEGGLLAPGAVVDGHYRVAQALGEGGMGVVYLARDIRLGRDVALKLGRAVSSAALARLEREAAALARLSHPNVVVVYEVGEIGGRVYLAMEHVAGGTLRTWMQTPRSWREVVAMFAAAGDGLAAAHDAGLVHRDFKPDNVLLGDDGRPRVADFGLVRADQDDATVDVEDSHPALASMTQTGAIMGTPAYMAPEQFAGQDVDARADQFAFCVATWEALFGKRPFAGATPALLRDAIATTTPRPDGGKRVPRHVVEVLRRGLARDRDLRWPSMTALCAALRRDPAARRRKWIAGAGLVAVGAGAAAIAVLSSAGEDPCAGAEQRIGRSWGALQAAAIRAQFATARDGAPWALQVADGTVAALDRWTAAYAVAERTACVEGAHWPAEAGVRATACLAKAQGALDAAVAVLRARDGDPAHAWAIVESLPPPRLCAEPTYLTSALPAPPTDLPRAAAYLALQRELDRVDDLRISGRAEVAQRALDALMPRIDALAFPPLSTQAAVERGQIALETGDNETGVRLLRDAYFAARKAGDARTATMAAVSAAAGLLNLTRDEAADDWGRLAEREADTVGEVSMRRQALGTLALVATDRGDAELALTRAEALLAMAGADVSARGVALWRRGAALAAAGRHSDAVRDLTAAAASIGEAHGEASTMWSDIMSDLSQALTAVGRYDEAIAAGERARARVEEIAGPDSERMIAPLGALIAAYTTSGHGDAALPLIDRSIAIERLVDGEGYNVASDLNNRAMALLDLGRYGEAEASWREAEAMARRTLGDDHPLVATIAGNVADAMWKHGDPEVALAAAERALRIWDARDPRHPFAAWALTARGALRRARGDRAGARADLERAVALRSTDDVSPSNRAESELELARLLADGGDRARARALATSARDRYAAASDSHVAAAEAFLRTLGR